MYFSQKFIITDLQRLRLERRYWFQHTLLNKNLLHSVLIKNKIIWNQSSKIFIHLASESKNFEVWRWRRIKNCLPPKPCLGWHSVIAEDAWRKVRIRTNSDLKSGKFSVWKLHFCEHSDEVHTMPRLLYQSMCHIFVLLSVTREYTPRPWISPGTSGLTLSCSVHWHAFLKRHNICF